LRALLQRGGLRAAEGHTAGPGEQPHVQRNGHH